MTPCIEHNQAGDYCTVEWEGRPAGLHRVVYATEHGLGRSDLEGLVVRHRCDNPRCINPDHLELGTQRDNILDCVRRGRRPKYLLKKQKITDQQVREIRAAYAKGGVTQRQLARQSQVRQDHISRIINFKARSYADV